MSRSVQFIRLVASALIAFAACFFVVAYDRTTTIRYPFDHPHADGYWTESGNFVMSGRIGGLEFVSEYCKYAYVVPLIGLTLGALVISRSPNRHALTELIVSGMWVLSLIWVGFVVIMWQCQNIPVFHGMQWHY
jgi:hypothetical protein